MKKALFLGMIFLGMIFLALLLESRISVFGTPPNLTAAIAYYFGLKHGETKGIFFGSLIGLLEDGLSGNILGPNLLGKGLVGFFSAFMSGSFFRWTPLLGMFGIFFLTALDGITVFFSRTAFELMPTSIPNAISIVIVSAIMNSFLGIFIRPQNA